MWHVQAQPYGSSRQQDVDIRDERARLSNWMRKRSIEAVVSTTDGCVEGAMPPPPRIPAIPGPRVVKLTLTGVWTQPLTNIIHAPYHCRLVIFWASYATQIGGCDRSLRHPTNNLYMPRIIQKCTMIKISAETNGPSASWPHPVLPFGR